jgi:hypothetical protein
MMRDRLGKNLEGPSQQRVGPHFVKLLNISLLDRCCSSFDNKTTMSSMTPIRAKRSICC